MKVRLNDGDVLGLSRVKVSDVGPRVIVAGDPQRAERIAQHLDNVREVGRNREYVTFSGEYRGTSVTVMSHGVGSAGAGAVFEELCRAGAEKIIRVGTAGGLQRDVVDGDLVVATAAVRGDGLSRSLVPLNYPAVAEPSLVIGLAAEASRGDHGIAVHQGIVLTSDNFYPSPVLENSQPMWREAGVLAVEMEIAALLTVASLNGVAAAAIVAIDGNPLADEDEAMSDYQPFRSIVDDAVERMIEVALDVVTR